MRLPWTSTPDEECGTPDEECGTPDEECGTSFHRFEPRIDETWVKVLDGWQKQGRYVRDICIDCGKTVERVDTSPTAQLTPEDA